MKQKKTEDNSDIRDTRIYSQEVIDAYEQQVKAMQDEIDYLREVCKCIHRDAAMEIDKHRGK